MLEKWHGSLFAKLGWSQNEILVIRAENYPGIDSDGPIPPAYVAWRATTTNRVFVQARHAGNRFLGSLKGLQIRAQVFLLKTLLKGIYN